MWPFNRTKGASEQPKNVRIDAEDLIEQKYTCREISEELGITQEEVYRIAQAKRRREARLTGNTPVDDERVDRIAQLREELSSVELQDRIDEAKHKAWLRQQERIEYEEEDIKELVDNSESPDTLLKTLLGTIFMKMNNPVNGAVAPASNTIQTTLSQPVEVSSKEVIQNPQSTPLSSTGFDFNAIEKGIKAGIITKERFIQECDKMSLSQEKASKLYDIIKKG